MASSTTSGGLLRPILCSVRSSSIPNITPTSSTLLNLPLRPLTQKRHEATARRLTKKLRVPPSSTYTNTTIPHDHIIFNPPASIPNVYHTPLKFLPPSDPRRKLLTRPRPSAMAPSNSSAPSGSSPFPQSRTSSASNRPRLPPSIDRPYVKKYHITAAEIEEIRALRLSDPEKWTRINLAEKFQCSPWFIGSVAPLPNHMGREIWDKKRAEARSRWGRRKIEAREDRDRRRETWGRVDY